MPLSQVKPADYQQQLDKKSARIRQQFTPLGLQQLDIFPSAPINFRMRAEFKLWHEGGDSYYVMFLPDQAKIPHRVDDFPIGSQLINSLMKQVLVSIKEHKELRHKLFQVEFLTTQSRQALITLIYHKKLDEQWQQLASSLASKLGVQIIGRSKKQKLLIDQDYVIEELKVKGNIYRYQQVESSFTQPNAGVNEQMLAWALEHSSNNGNDLLELYCGNGNFTTVLAQNFRRVLATEISKTSVKSARYNFELNGITNVSIARMSSEEFSQALAGTREFRRLKGIDLKSYDFSTILVDPPRAGLDTLTEQWVASFDNIIYISCNPETLHNNLSHICKTHRISRFAIFDQFPYTAHIECGVMLQRIAGENHG